MNYHCKTDRLTEIFLCDLEASRFDGEEYLPSELRLCEMYQVSRNTLRRMLARLIADGMLTRDDSRRIPVPRRMKKTGNSPCISIIWAYAAYPDPMISLLTAGIQRYCREEQLDLQMITSQESHESVLCALQGAGGLGANGVLLLNFLHDNYTQCINSLLDEGIPVVTIGSAGESKASSCCGDCNGADIAIAQLIEKYDRPVYLMSSPHDDKYLLQQGRYWAWRRAMDNAGFGDLLEKYTCKVISGDDPKYWPMEQKLFRATYQFAPHFDKMEFPASVFCFDAYLARRLYLAAEERGLVIGRDLMVLCFDDLPFVRRLNPPLSAIHVDSELLGYRAAKLLHQSVLQRFPEPVHIKVPSEFIERNSF